MQGPAEMNANTNIVCINHHDVFRAQVLAAVVDHVDARSLDVIVAVEIVLARQVAHDGGRLHELKVTVAQARQLTKLLQHKITTASNVYCMYI